MSRAEPLRLLAAFLLMTLLAPRVLADDQDEISFQAGLLSLKTGKTTASGSAYGLRYLHSRTPFIGLGLEIDFLRPGDKRTDKLIENIQASTALDSASMLGVMRIGPTEGDLRPNFLIGLGIHFTSIRLEAQPKAGFGWADTGTTEKRRLLDSSGKAAAVKIQGGADYALTDNFITGAFLGWNYMGTARYEATDQAKSLGVSSISGSMSAITLGVNLAARF